MPGGNGGGIPADGGGSEGSAPSGAAAGKVGTEAGGGGTAGGLESSPAMGVHNVHAGANETQAAVAIALMKGESPYDGTGRNPDGTFNVGPLENPRG